MGVIISSKNQEKRFEGKEIINIGTNKNCDFYLDLGFDLLLTLNYNATENKCILVNNFGSKDVLFKGQPIGAKAVIGSMCKLMIPRGDDFITIKLAASEPSQTAQVQMIASTVQHQPQPMPQMQAQIPPQTPPVHHAPPQKTMAMIQDEDFTESDIRGIYGNAANAEIKVKLDKRKSDLDSQRVSILKEIGFFIEDLKKKLDINSKSSNMANAGLVVIPFLSVGLLADGFKAIINTQSKASFIPDAVKMLLIFAVIVILLAITLRQGMFLYFQNKITKQPSRNAKMFENVTIIGSLIGFIVLYIVMIGLYMRPSIGLSFQFCVLGGVLVGIVMIDAMLCGYLKHSREESEIQLDKYESREDFQNVMQQYQQWINLYINNFSLTKVKNIKEKMFNTQIKSAGETVLGVLTAPFLAYGVSNTLAMCFPDAAGWIRVSGFRYSPIFLTLATFLIVFAFFAFTNSFFCTRKAKASEVIKKDGFSNYMHHGVDIYGNEGLKKLQGERTRSFIIAATIIFIEFSMNISYFVTEIGGDFKGLFLSTIAALVPTALLIAETYMLSETQFHIFAQEELISKIDRDYE